MGGDAGGGGGLSLNIPAILANSKIQGLCMQVFEPGLSICAG